MLKRLTSVGMALLLLFTLFCFQVSANEYEKDIEKEIETRYSYTHSCSSGLSISGLNASCKSSLNGYPGITTKIEVTQTLQVKNGSSWRKAASWSATYYSYSCVFNNSRTVYSGNQYRVKSEFKVYSGSSYETITDYSYNVST